MANTPHLSAAELRTAATSVPKGWLGRPYTVIAIDPAPDGNGVTGAGFRITTPALKPIQFLDPRQPKGTIQQIGESRTSVYGSLHSGDMRDVWSLAGDDNGGCPDVIVLELFETGGRVDKYMIGTIQSVGGWIALAHKCGAQLFLHYPINRYPCMDQAKDTVHAIYQRDARKWTAEARHEVDAMAHLHTWELLTDHPGKFGYIYEPHPQLEWAFVIRKVK